MPLPLDLQIPASYRSLFIVRNSMGFYSMSSIYDLLDLPKALSGNINHLDLKSHILKWQEILYRSNHNDGWEFVQWAKGFHPLRNWKEGLLWTDRPTNHVCTCGSSKLVWKTFTCPVTVIVVPKQSNFFRIGKTKVKLTLQSNIAHCLSCSPLLGGLTYCEDTTLEGALTPTTRGHLTTI